MLQISNTERVLEVFFREPTKSHYLLDISRKINLAHTSVKKELDTLVKSGILSKIIELRGKRKFPLYFAVQDNIFYKNSKKIHNIRRIFDSGITEHINNDLYPKCMILFGSYERGEDVEESDIDLFLECEQSQINLKKYEKILGRKIQLHFKKNFSEFPQELKNNIINGIVLSGFLEVFNDNKNNSR